MFNKTIFIFLLLFSLIPLQVNAKFFSDVSSHHDYYKAIKTLEKEDVLGGYEDGTFLPGKVINRAEFLKIAIGAKTEDVKLIASTKKSEEIEKYQDCFKDVESEWFAPYVCYAQKEGWVEGYSDNSFKPSNEITFAEAMAILSRIFELDTTAFDDSHWYYPYQRYFDIFDLVPNIQQSMDFQLNRGEMAELVYRIQNHLEDLSAEEIKNKIEEQKRLEEFKFEVFKLVNEERRKLGKGELLYNIQLEKIADMHAQDMIDRDFFAHVNPDGVDVLTRVKTYNYDQRDVGENIALGQETPEEVMTSWMNSVPHRENLLKSNFIEMGVGIFPNERGDLAWVQVFGKQCSERDNVVGCISRAEYQSRNEGEWVSPYKWY